MATITIRNLDDRVKRALQIRAASNGKSMESEARELLTEAVETEALATPQDDDLATAIRRRLVSFGGADIPLPPRQFSERPIPKFDE